MKIYFDGELKDTFDVEIPGSHVKTLTSASRLIKEYSFKDRYQKLIDDLQAKYPEDKKDVKLDKDEEAQKKTDLE